MMASENLLQEADCTRSLLDELPHGEQIAEDLRNSYVCVQATIQMLANKIRAAQGGAGAVYQLDKMVERRSRIIDDVRAYIAANSGTAALLDAEQALVASQVNNHLLNLVNDLRMLVQDCVQDRAIVTEVDKRLRDLFMNRYVGKFGGTVKEGFDRLRDNLG